MMRRILVSAALCMACAEPTCLPIAGTQNGQMPTAFHLATARSYGASGSRRTACSKMIMAPPAANRVNQGSKMLYSRLVSSIKAPLSSWLSSFGNAPKTIERVEQMAHRVDVCKESIDKVYKQIRGSSASSQALSGQHQVLEAIKTRVESRSKPGARRDKHKIALAIEGGGMRGCVSAGMAAALEQLGLSDAFDVVYGSSAGSLIGAYFVAGGGMAETHRFFLEVLCESKTAVFDPSRLLDLLRHPNRADLKPAMCLDAISNIMCYDTGEAYLDWNKFEKRNRVQPLKIIASDVSAGRAVALSSLRGSFHDRSSLMKCLKASCFLPGIAGSQPVRLTQNSATSGVASGREIEEADSMLLVDALIYEPMPYRSALEDGCTHVLVLRTWPDDHALPQSFMRIFEKLLAPACLRDFPNVMDFLFLDKHARIYGEDILHLNQGAQGASISGAHILPLAVPLSTPVSQMELDKNVLLQGILSGFSQAYRILAPIADQQRVRHLETLARRNDATLQPLRSEEPLNIDARSGSDVAKALFEMLQVSSSIRRAYSKLD